MKPPTVYEETNPTTQRMSKTTAMVPSTNFSGWGCKLHSLHCA